MLMHSPDASSLLRLPTRPDWTGLVAGGEAVLLLGQKALPQSAGAAHIDAFLNTALAAYRLLSGRARTR